jgi:serine/threonine-protein kinase
VVDIVRQIGDALNAAHAQGVIHRDLKSDNIMLLDTMTGDHAKVLDFGIAKINEPEGVTDTNLTAPNLVVGTPQYMSPEQCAQEGEIDSRSDIYSLGVILYEMLVGHVPFSGESPTMVMMKHLQEPVPSVLDERPDVPAAVGRVVARAMAKVRDDRYQNVVELVEDLTIAAGMTVNRVAPSSVTSAYSSATPETDEVTMVRTREEPTPSSPRRAPVRVPVESQYVPPAQAPASFNPVKILIPAAVILLVVFAGFYVFMHNSPASSNTNTNQTNTLIADPNSQPVQAGPSPTGKSEVGIPSGGTVTAPVVSASPAASPEASVDPLEDLSPAPANENANTNSNNNSNSNSNSNRKAPALPEPTKSVNPEVPPPPAPSATKTPVEKPSPAATPN